MKSPILLFPLALACCACSHDVPEPPTGVLLISVDSLRADHLSCYGYRSPTRPELDTSPIVDRMLAASGTRFTCAVSTTSWTLPAHMSMLTGLPNELHGVRETGFPLSASHTLLAETFRDAGWRTAGFWSGPNLHPFFGFGRGFEAYVDCSTSRVTDGDALFGVHAGMDDGELSEKRTDLKAVHDGSHRGISGPTVVAAFSEWLEGVAAEERFFAFVHLWDVHYDYEPPPEFDLFYPGYRGRADGSDIDGRSTDRNPPKPDELRRIVSLYDGEIRFTDHNVGRILDRLVACGRLDDTLIVFTADHGEEFLEHNMLGHGNSLYEEVVRIPLILRYPPLIDGGRTIDVPVSLVDVAPTILDLCGLDAPQPFYGESLRLALSGDLERRELPLERSYLRAGEELHLETIRAVHAGDYKLIRQTDEDGGKIFVYDLALDPREQAPRQSGALDRNDPRLRAARALWLGLDARAAELGAPAELPPALRRDLENTGYIDSEAGSR